MGLENSSQSRYFLFEDQQALIACKHDAAVVRSLSIESNLRDGKLLRKVKPRSFACGYQQKGDDGSICQSSSPQYFQTIDSLCGSPTRMTSTDQEVIIHFHAHHMHRLVGPSAIYPELRRITSTLATAVMLFRRFYLSNSVIDFPAHAMAAASALLAAKVDCEPSLPIRFLSYATGIISRRARHGKSELQQELQPVSIEEIEEAERNLLVGLDYRLRCHHPYGAIRVVAGDICAGKWRDTQQNYGIRSPRDASMGCSDKMLDYLRERATAIVQAALVYSDVHFLYPPGKIGFAAIAITLDGRVQSGALGPKSQDYLRKRFSHKTSEEISAFEHDVIEIIREIDACPEIDLTKFSGPMYTQLGTLAQERTSEIHRAFSVAAYFRCMVQSETEAVRAASPIRSSRKRMHTDTYSNYPHSLSIRIKAAKVTPTPCRML